MTAPSRVPPAGAEPSTRLTEVADGVFAYVQHDGTWCINNAGLVTGGDTNILVDTAATEARARRLREAIHRVVPDGPHILVNTHHHGDHVFGNALFTPATTVVAHERARTEMAESGLGLQKLWPNVDWGDLPLVLPHITFRDTLTMYAGDLRLDLLHVGPAHTTNDVVVWIPERKVLFSGDVLMSGVTPYCMMGSIEGSLTAIDRLRALGAETVVTGHGPVAGPELFDSNAAYLRWVQHLAEEGARAGLTPLETAREADITTAGFGELLDPERLVGNLHRADAEHRGLPPGAPIDVLRSFQEMAEYHGGLPDCHA